MAEQKTRLEIEGMSCAGCAAKITSALQRSERVSTAVIDYATRTGVVEGDISQSEISQIISSVGYKVVSFGHGEHTDSKLQGGLTEELRNAIMAFMLALPVMLIAMGPWHFDGGNLTQAILTTLFILGPARGFFIRAVKQLTHRFVTMDTLVAIGIGSAWLVSVVMMQMERQGHLYFESAVMIGFFVLFGKALEDWARRKSIGEVDRLVRLRPRTLWRLTADGQPEEVSVSLIKVGEKIYIRPGDMVALDAVVIDGRASFDESIITGESEPIIKSQGDSVASGSVNAGATGITLMVTRVGSDTTVERIIQLIEGARLSRPPIQKLADKIANVFVPAVIFLAAVTFLYWLLVEGRAPTEALMIGLSVLVVACPCALGLATPVAWVAGLGRAARSGILVRSYESLETLRRASVIIFDKTGTLTEGRPKVCRVISLDDFDPSKDYGMVLSAVAHSSHPLSRAISQYIRGLNLTLDIPLSKLLQEQAGLGVVCEIKTDAKKIVSYGRPSFVTKNIPENWLPAINSGNPVVAFAVDEKPLLLFELQDLIRSDAGDSLAKMKAKGLEVHVASGDKSSVVQAIKQALPSIDSMSGQMTPQSKKDMVSQLQKSGKVVAFVGDGINDAPALATADVGIAMGSGTDVAAHSAGLVLQKSGLEPILMAVELSTRITRIIKENFFWAFFYNVAAIPVAMMGLITPMWASLAMALSSVSVVTNALRLRR